MKYPILLSALLVSLPTMAQEPLSAERPSFSSSPIALDSGFWQLEGGYQYIRSTSDVDGYALPLLLLRYGAGDNTEVQLSWSGYNRVDVGPLSFDGVSDMNLGVKWQLSDDDATTPFGLFASLSLPVGDNDFSSNEVDPTVGLFWAHAGRASLFGTVLVSESGNDTTIGNGVGINLPMADRCKTCSAYLEFVSLFPEGRGPQHNINGGISWLRSNDFQIDVNLGVGLNDRADDGYFGFGAAYRF
ncbi:MAG: transporter [Woeseia sp.]